MKESRPLASSDPQRCGTESCTESYHSGREGTSWHASELKCSRLTSHIHAAS